MIMGKDYLHHLTTINWLTCYVCAIVIPIREVKKEGRITPIKGVEVINNPFDFGKCKILGVDSKNRYSKLKR